MSWNLDANDFPHDGPLDAQLRFALRYAVLAPSSHNSQPWRFIIDGQQLHLVADRSRALPVVDPYDRQLIISCGAALMNLCVALAHFGIGYEIDAFPAQADADLLATLRVRGDRPANPDLVHLFPALSMRCTNRQPFAPDPVPESLQAALGAAAEAEGVALLTVVGAAQRQQLAALVTEADQAQFADPRFRRELAAWLHAGRADDGMPAYATSIPALLDFDSPILSLVTRTFDLGEGVAARDGALAQGSPLLLCFATTRDTAPDWLFTGQALERVLLTARLEGYDASYLNQPIEIPELRERLRSLLACGGMPQLLIRVGKGPPAAHTPRRPVEAVVS